jgi:hypothetical protein
VALSLSLSLAACTQNRSVGAVGDANDASMEVQGPADAVDLPDDVPVDVPTDTVPGIPCVDNGISYQVGDVVPRGTSACLISCICLPGGIVGRCTGACPGDASSDGSGRVQVAVIDETASTNSPEIRVFVFDDGSAERTIVDGSGALAGTARVYPSGSPEGTLFLYDLAGAGDLGTLGDPINMLFETACGKSVSFGTITRVTAGGVTSGDLQCLVHDPTPSQTALAHDCEVLTGMVDPLFGNYANRCLATNGQPSHSACCAATGDFPDTCSVGACGCSPANSHDVATCICPLGGCWVQNGCAGPAGVCTVGADQTCNDDPSISSIHGQCVADGRCSCNLSVGPLLASGKCP